MTFLLTGAASQLNGGTVAVLPLDGILSVYATDTWGFNASGNFSNPANWRSGVWSTAGDDLVLGVLGMDGPIPSSPFNDYPAGALFHSVTLNGGCTLSGKNSWDY